MHSALVVAKSKLAVVYAVVALAVGFVSTSVRAQTNVMADGDFENGLTDWFALKLSPAAPTEEILLAPELLALETADVWSGTGALRLTLQPQEGHSYTNRISGAAGVMTHHVPEGSTLRVEFSAKSLSGPQWLHIGKLWGGGDSIVPITTSWQRHVAYVWLVQGTPHLLFNVMSQPTQHIVPLPSSSVLLDDIRVSLVESGHANLVSYGGYFESGHYSPWYGQKMSLGVTAAAPEFLNPSWPGPGPDYLGSLELSISKQSGSEYPIYLAGAVAPLLAQVAAGSLLRVKFSARRISGASWISVTRAWGGAQANAHITDSWQEHEVELPLQQATSELVFSLLDEDSYGLQPAADGVVLIDNVDVRLVGPPQDGLVYHYRADHCATPAQTTGEPTVCADVRPENGQHMYLAGGPAPSVVNDSTGGWPALVSAGGTTLRTTGLLQSIASYTMAYVFRKNTPGPSELMWHEPSPGGAGVKMRVWPHVQYFQTFWDGGQSVISLMSPPFLAPSLPSYSDVGELVVVRGGPGGAELWVNGVRTASTDQAVQPILLDGRLLVTADTVEISETLAYDHALNDAELSALQRSLRIRYAIDRLRPHNLFSAEAIHEVRTTGTSPSTGYSFGAPSNILFDAANGLVIGSEFFEGDLDTEPLITLPNGMHALPFDGSGAQYMYFGPNAGWTDYSREHPTETDLSDSFTDYTMTVVATCTPGDHVHDLIATYRQHPTPWVTNGAGYEEWITVQVDGSTGKVRYGNWNQPQSYKGTDGCAVVCGEPFVVTFRGSSTLGGNALFVNGTKVYSDSGPVAAVGMLPFFGDTFQGALAEAAVHLEALTDREIEAYQEELNVKFSIQPLPASCSPCVGEGCAVCGDGVVSGGEACDTAASSTCAVDCALDLGYPSLCHIDTECGPGQVCPVEPNGDAFMQDSWQRFCVPQALCPQQCGTTLSAPCGLCVTPPSCAVKRCGDDPNDGAGGYCVGFCKEREPGCHSDEDCASGLVCGLGIGARFDLPPESNVCVRPSCADYDVTRVPCGELTAECGRCISLPNECGTQQCGSDRFGHTCGSCGAGAFCLETGACALADALVPKHRDDVYEQPRTGLTDPQAVSPGTLPGTFAISNSGTAQYVIPIDVPPGPGGVQPRLELAYDSSTGDGVIAQGWNLRGFSIIHRCNGRDETAKGVELDERDHLCLDGLPLVQVDGERDMFEDQEYRTKPDTLRRIHSHGNPDSRFPHQGPTSFSVHNPDGTFHTYEARREATLGWAIQPGTHEPNTPVRYEWHLSSISGPNVNTIYIGYDRFEAEVTSRFDEPIPAASALRLRYTAELRPKWMNYGIGRTVKFAYSSDKPELFAKDFTFGIPRHQSTPLSTIETYVEGVLVKKYVLATTRQGRAKVLESIQVCAPDGPVERCMPKTVFDYEREGADFAPATPTSARPLPTIASEMINETSRGEYNANSPVVFDWNGDGYDDLIYRGEGGKSDGSAAALLVSNGPVTQGEQFTQLELYGGQKIHNQAVHVIDVNEDGRDDLLVLYHNTDGTHDSWLMTSQDLATSPDGPEPFARQQVDTDVDQIFIYDVDTDGRKDYVACSDEFGSPKGEWEWRRNAGTGTFGEKQSVQDVDIPCDAELLDMDGNGTEEIVGFYHKWDAQLRYYVQSINVLSTYLGVSSVRSVPAIPSGVRRFMDANGDGRVDVLTYLEKRYHEPRLALYLNTGARFTAAASYPVDPKVITSDLFDASFVADRDGDGIGEIYIPQAQGRTGKSTWLRHEPLSREPGGGERWRVTETTIEHDSIRFSYGCGTFRTCDAWFYAYNIPTAADVDGDGDSDLLVRTYNNDSGHRYPRLVLHKAGSSKRNLLTSVANGMGVKTEITYDDGVADPAYTPGSCNYPAHCLRRLPFRVVSAYSTSGSGGPYRDPQFPADRQVGTTHHLEYADARIDRQGRGWIGMRQKIDRQMTLGGGIQLSAHTSLFDLSFNASERAYPLANVPLQETTETEVLAGRRGASPFSLIHVEHQQGYQFRVLPDRRTFLIRLEAASDVRTENSVFVGGSFVEYSNFDRHGNAQRIVEGDLEGRSLSNTVVSYGDFSMFSDPDLTAIREVYPDLQDPGLARRQERAVFSRPLAVVTRAVRDGIANTRMHVNKYTPLGYPVERVRFELARDTVEWTQMERTITTFNSFGNLAYMEQHAPGQAVRSLSVTYDRQGTFPLLIENGEHAAKGIPPTLVWFDPRFGQKAFEVRPDGVFSFMGSDPFGRPKLALGDGQPTLSWTYSGSTESGSLRVEVADLRGATQTSDYNAFGMPTRVQIRDSSSAPRSLEFGYNDRGQFVAESVPHLVGQPVRGTHFYVRDNLERLISESHPIEDASGVVTEAVSRIEYGSSATLASEHLSLFQHNGGETAAFIEPAGRAARVVVTDGNGVLRASMAPDSRLSLFKYDPFGGLAVRESEGERWEGTYDGAGNLLRSVDPDRGTEEFLWNGFGELSAIWRSGANVLLSHDALGRPTTRTAPEGVSTWEWDGDGSEPGQAGHVSLTTTPHVSTSYHYEAPGARLSSKTVVVDGVNVTTNFSFDGDGLLRAIDYPNDGASQLGVEYVRNPYGRVIEVRRLGDEANALWREEEVDAFGRSSRVRYGNGAIANYTPYLATGQTKQIRMSRASSVLFDESYEYDSSQRLKTRSLAGSPAETYLYDQNDRLHEIHVGGALNRRLDYDSNGNLKTSPLGHGLEYHDPRPHAVSGSTAEDHYYYDDRGNQNLRVGPSVAGSRQSIAYTSFDLPDVVYAGEEEREVARFVYDSEMARVKETTEDSEYLTIDGLRLDRSLSDNTFRMRAMVPAPDGTTIELDGSEAQASVRYHHVDRLGSTRLITAADEDEPGRGAYDVFGGPAVSWNQSERGLTSFTGHAHDHSLGLTDMKGRMYDPALGRFLSPDPFVQGVQSVQSWNRFSYVWNDPLNFVDPSGFQGVPIPPVPPPPATMIVDVQGAYIKVGPQLAPPAPTAAGPTPKVAPAINSPSAVSPQVLGGTTQTPKVGATPSPSVASPTGVLSETPAQSLLKAAVPPAGPASSPARTPQMPQGGPQSWQAQFMDSGARHVYDVGLGPTKIFAAVGTGLGLAGGAAAAYLGTLVGTALESAPAVSEVLAGVNGHTVAAAGVGAAAGAGVGAAGGGAGSARGPAATLELAQKIAAAGEGPAWARTVGVMETREGVTLVGAGARDLTAAQKTLAESLGLKVVADFPDIHAEGTLLNGAGQLGLTPQFGVVTNNVCSGVCSPMIEGMGGWTWGRYFGFSGGAP